MPYTRIVPKGSPPPLAIDREGKTVGVGDARAQTRFILESIRSVLEAAGGSLKDIAFNQIFLKDYPAMNEVYREFFPRSRRRATASNYQPLPPPPPPPPPELPPPPPLSLEPELE